MIAHVALKQLDHDFRILQQLSTRECRPVVDGRLHCTIARIRTMRDEGLIISQKGRHGGYKLVYPLDGIFLSHWLTHRESLQQPGPTLTLLNRFSDVSVETLLTYQPFTGESFTVLFDSLIEILARLSPTSLTLAGQLSCRYGKGHMTHIVTELTRYGITHRPERHGIVLTKPFEEMTINDILPVLSHVSLVFSSLLCQSGNVRLTEFLGDNDTPYKTGAVPLSGT